MHMENLTMEILSHGEYYKDHVTPSESEESLTLGKRSSPPLACGVSVASLH